MLLLRKSLNKSLGGNFLNKSIDKSFEERLIESKKILLRYPNRVPIFCSGSYNSELPIIDKNKFLVPKNLTVSQFSYVIRKRMEISPEQAIFLRINNTLINGRMELASLYDKYKDADGFLYIEYSGENVFG